VRFPRLFLKVLSRSWHLRRFLSCPRSQVLACSFSFQHPPSHNLSCMRTRSRKALIATRRLQIIPASLPTMPPKSFLPLAHSVANDDADQLPERFDELVVSDSSPPELVDPESLEEDSVSEGEYQPSPDSHELKRIGITVSSSTHPSKKEICLKEIEKLAATHGFTMTVFSPVSSRPNSPSPACGSRSASPTLPGCPHDEPHHIRCHDTKGSYCVVRRSAGAPTVPPRAEPRNALSEEDLQRLFSYLNQGWSRA